MSDASSPPPHLVRRVTAAAVLDAIRGADIVTVTEVMERTALTRATVLSVCEDLMTRGWIRECTSPRDAGGPQVGRPARRFELEERAGCVIGIDVGVRTCTVVVADLRGESLARASLPFAAPDIDARERIGVISDAAMRALDEAGESPATVLAVTVGLAAPVDRDGNVLASQPFWRRFDVGLRKALGDRYGWVVMLENDANLAALGERWRGAGVGVDDLVVLLAGERFGSGILESGRLLHGASGGAGEMGYLDVVEGVGSPLGIAYLARQWGTEALVGRQATALRTPAMPGEEVAAQQVTAQGVFAAAAAGDEVAHGILERLAERLARVVCVVATMLNPRLVVVGGAVAESAGALLDAATRKLAELTPAPPRLAVSPLGDAIVTVGAIRCSLDYVEANSLDMELAH